MSPVRTRPRRRATKRPIARGRPRAAGESVKDLTHAVQQISTARLELIAIDASRETSRHKVAALLIEPLARLELVRRYIVEIQQRHRWRPAT